MKKIQVSDITLKAVKEQELSLTFKEKLQIAEKLDLAKLDAIELPALIDSKENEIIYRTISSSVKNATIKIPVGDSVESLKTAVECVKGANKYCLQIVMPVSTTLMEYFYHMKAPQMQAKIVELIKASKEKCNCVELVAKDAFRAEKGYVAILAKSAFEAGANSITVCDDAGVALPEDYAEIIKEIKAVCDIEVFVCPSNALCMSAASAVCAIKAGADGVKTSVSGNYLSTSVFSDIIRNKGFDLGVCSQVDVTNANSIMGEINGVVVDNAESFADKVESDLVIDNSCSVKQVSEIVKQLGYELSDSDLGKVYEEIKKLTVNEKTIDGKELETVIASNAMQVPSTYHLVNYVVNSGNNIPATANVILEKNGQKFTGVSTGDGPIDAAFNAIEQIIGHHYELDDFQVHAVTKGRGAVGSSIIRLRADGKLYPGNGASTDIIGACIRAFVNALNKIVYEEN